MQQWWASLFTRRVSLLETQLAIANGELHELGREHARVQARFEQAAKREAYWQQRCEKLIDAALARAQMISEPVMGGKDSSEFDRAARSVIGSLGMTSFPSSKA